MNSVKRQQEQAPGRKGKGSDSQSGHVFAMALRAAYLTLHRETDNALSSCGITADQFVVLAALRQADASTQRELVDRTSSDPSTLRAMLVLLEQKGLVERPAHPTDGRARSVRLTAAGQNTVTQAWSLTDGLRLRMARALRTADIAVLIYSLEEVVRGMVGDSAAGDTQPEPLRDREHP